MKKRGAIELSMNTIIIVVIGITLLTLGLKFVYDTFQGISEKQAKVESLTDKQLAEMFTSSEDAITLPREVVKIKQGSSEYIDVVLRNIGGREATIKYSVEVDAMPEGVTEDDVLGWITYSEKGRKLASGRGFKDKMLVDLPRSAPLGNYRLVLTLECGSAECGDGETAILGLKVV